MDEAIVVFSRKGIFQTTIASHDVRSREYARKLWPLFSPGALRQMVTWGSPSFESCRSEAESTTVFAPLLVECPFDVFAHQR